MPKRGCGGRWLGGCARRRRFRRLWPPTQVPLERSFGSWRIGALYLLSGIFGTMVSVIFLPDVLSVGASASVFGLIGALTPTPNPNPDPTPTPTQP